MDYSNGYEPVAKTFIAIRSKSKTGTSHVRRWVTSFPKNSAVLDLGCGSGVPITQVLLEEKMKVFAIDASPTLVGEFQLNFPNVPVKCESVEHSSFFHLKYDGIISWGLLFLLTEAVQLKVLKKMSDSLKPGGRLLFTSPRQKTEWEDTLTGRKSLSLGAIRYRKILREHGLSVIKEFSDEGENYYFEAKVNDNYKDKDKDKDKDRDKDRDRDREAY